MHSQISGLPRAALLMTESSPVSKRRIATLCTDPRPGIGKIPAVLMRAVVSCAPGSNRIRQRSQHMSRGYFARIVHRLCTPNRRRFAIEDWTFLLATRGNSEDDLRRLRSGQ